MVSMMDRREMKYESFKIKLNLIKKMIERDPNYSNLLTKMSRLGLYRNLIDRYIEHSKDSRVCLLICEFIIFSVSKGKRVVQEALYSSIGREIENRFLNCVSDNLKIWYNKFEEREYIRNEFFGFIKAYPTHNKNINDQIEVAMEHMNSHLTMLRFLCEGHYQPMQEFVKFQQY
jgi:hypothetical protein